jgi:hypothetical protein
MISHPFKGNNCVDNCQIPLGKMRSRKASMQLIECAVFEGWIKQLAFYHLLKFRFINGCIYSYKSRMDEIASSFNISPKTFYNYLKILRSKGLICDHTDNLKLRSIHDFKTNRKKCVLVMKENHSLFDITCLLYAKLIERKARQQAFRESLRRFGRGDRFISETRGNPFLPSLSFRTLAKLLKISENKAYRVIKNLNRLEVLKTEKQKPKLLKENLKGLKYYVEDLPGYRFEIGNRLFELYGCKHDFLQFPVHLKKITIRQYKKHINNDL